SIAHQTIARLDVAVDIDAIPLLGVADIVDRHVIVLAPKERHLRKSLFLPKHISCDSLTLTLGHNPMLDPDVLARMRIGPARNVSGCIYSRYAGLEIFVDGDAAVNFDACAF